MEHPHDTIEWAENWVKERRPLDHLYDPSKENVEHFVSVAQTAEDQGLDFYAAVRINIAIVLERELLGLDKESPV